MSFIWFQEFVIRARAHDQFVLAGLRMKQFLMVGMCCCFKYDFLFIHWVATLDNYAANLYIIFTFFDRSASAR